MKKVWSLILVLAVCLSLCACSVSAPATPAAPAATEKPTLEVVGTWKGSDGSSEVYIYLNEDHTGAMEAGGIALKFAWVYNEYANLVTLVFEVVDLPGKLTYHPENDTLVFPDGIPVLSRVS